MECWSVGVLESGSAQYSTTPTLHHSVPSGERLLRFHGSRECVRRGGEGGAEGVADGLEDVAAVALDGGAEDPVVAAEGLAHLLRVVFPEACAPLDVGEEEGDR